jgi:uncharacterized membrane protein YdjX (TVP38/TMEM64 family)
MAAQRIASRVPARATFHTAVPGGRSEQVTHLVGPQVNPKRRLVVLSVTLLAGAALAVVAIGPIRQDLMDFVEGFGTTAPVAFVVLYALLSLALVPGSLLSVAAGVLFGPLTGTVLAVVGGAFGATGAFLIGRRLGRTQVEHLAGDRVRTMDRWLEAHGATAIALVRIIPGVPYSILNYAAGLTGISTRDYVTGTAVGLVPGAFVYAAFGGTLDAPTSPGFAAAITGIVLFLIAGTFAERWLRVTNG